MRGLNNFKALTKETGGNINVVPNENAISWTANKTKETVLREADTRSLMKRIHKGQATCLAMR